MEIEPEWLFSILLTAIAHLSLIGGVNTQNCLIWSTDQSHEIVQQSLHHQKDTVWCDFPTNFFIGPYFFEKTQNGEIVFETMTGERYLQIL